MPSSSSAPNVQLQDRDIALLKGLFESRIMSLDHIAAIHFGGSREAAKKRVQKLKASGFLGERPRRAYEPSILFLARKAFTALAEGGYLDEYPPLAWTNLEKRARVADLTLRHELDVMDFKAAMFSAVRAVPALRIVEFTTWPLLYEFQASPNDGVRDMTVRPDGFLRLHETEADGSVSEHSFFLEMDRSTEVLDTLVTRSSCYRNFYRRGGLAVRFGHAHSEFEQFPFRVLIVVRNAERRNNLCERLLSVRPPILSQVWLTTFYESRIEPLGAIWIRPHDYREAMTGTPFATSANAPQAYRRHGNREEHAKKAIQKLPLIAIQTK